MQTGLTLSQLGTTLLEAKAAKQDYIVPAHQAEMVVIDGDKPTVALQSDHGQHKQLPDSLRGILSHPLRPIAHDQIATYLGMPRQYYDRMQTEAPELLADNVNTWLQRKSADKDDRRMIRTMSNNVRAFLSNRYARIENDEIAAVVLPILQNTPGMKVVSCQVTERKLYIQAVTDRITREVKRGDAVQAGVSISNSEIGLGAVVISPLVWRLICLNGMVALDGVLRSKHVGQRIDETEAFYQDDTRAADDRAVLLKVRDHVTAALDVARFDERVGTMQTLAGVQVTGKIERSVEVLAKKVGATEDETDSILRSLIEGADLTAWGMINAVTNQAHRTTSYDRAVEFEAMGGQLLAMPANDWQPILAAA